MPRVFQCFRNWLLVGLVCAFSATSLVAAEITPQETDAMVAKAIDYLQTKGQKEDGSFSPQASPARGRRSLLGGREQARRPTLLTPTRLQRGCLQANRAQV